MPATRIGDVFGKGSSSSSITIGSSVSGGTDNEILYVDGSGNLAQSTALTFSGTTTGILPTLSASSGNQQVLSITPTVNQSGTAGYTGIFTNITESATGSGLKQLVDLQVGSVDLFQIDHLGQITSTTVSANTSIGGLAGLYLNNTNTANGGVGTALMFQFENTTPVLVKGGVIDVIQSTKTAGSETSAMRFGNIVAGTLAERMRIHTNGLIGINVAAPTALLHVTGLTPASVATSPGTAGTRIVQFNNSGVGGQTSITTTGVGGVGADAFYGAGNGGTAPSALVSSTGGAGGQSTWSSGTGGAAAVAGSGTNNGGNGGPLSSNAGAGGAASGSTSGVNTGGTGSVISLVGGTGGIASGSTLTNTSGAGGASTLNGGAGAASSDVTAVTNTAGVGGTSTLNGGTGGAASGASTTNTAGNGGAMTVKGGTGGIASGTGAVQGNGGLATLAGGIAAAVAGSAGGGASVNAAPGSATGSGGAGGAATITGGAAGGDNTVSNAGGAVTISAGASKGSSVGGQVTIAAGAGGLGTGTAGAAGGSANLTGGAGGLGSSTAGSGGAAIVRGGAAANLAGAVPGSATIIGGTATTATTGGGGGSANVTGANASGDQSTNNAGGNTTMSAGTSSGTTAGGSALVLGGTGGIGPSTTGANGGTAVLQGGAGGANTTGGVGGNVLIKGGVQGAGGSAGGGSILFQTAATTSLTTQLTISNAGLATFAGHLVVEGITSTGGTGTGNFVFSASPTLTGSPLAPTQAATDNSTKIATTAYVTTGISNAIAGVNPAIAVSAATTAASDTSALTYNNGVSGIGATFTGTNNTAFTVDGFTFTALNQRVLIKNDTQSPSGAFNGVYYVTQVQTAILPPILTRSLDYDQSSDINSTGAIPVVNGTVNALTSWLLTSSVTTVGTDPLTYSKFSINPSSQARTDVAQTFTGTQTFSQMITTNNAITASSNAATVPITSRLSTVTNNSAAPLTVTLTTTSAVDGQMIIVRIYDFSAVAQTLNMVNTENSTNATTPATTNGSTTLPLTLGYMFNSATTKYRLMFTT